MKIPAFTVEHHDFWGAVVTHVKLPDATVNVVVDDAFRLFCGITDPSNQSKKLKESIAEVKAGNIESLDTSDLTPFHTILNSGRTSSKTHQGVVLSTSSLEILFWVKVNHVVRHG
jgi:hypothetical protein